MRIDKALADRKGGGTGPVGTGAANCGAVGDMYADQNGSLLPGSGIGNVRGRSRTAGSKAGVGIGTWMSCCVLMPLVTNDCPTNGSARLLLRLTG
jgi:hypothetical protein